MKMQTVWLVSSLALGLAFWTPSCAGEKNEAGEQHNAAQAAKRNPVQASAASIAKGKEVFARHCADCHGERGDGDTRIGKEMKPPAANLTDTTWSHGVSDGEIYNTIIQGVPGTGMPPFEKTVQGMDRWHLVNYIKSLSPKKAETTTKAAKVVYTCPMHPEVISDKPGKCPKCGMNLVKKES
jgi:mono/diheme cytochrome c family protein